MRVKPRFRRSASIRQRRCKGKGMFYGLLAKLIGGVCYNNGLTGKGIPITSSRSARKLLAGWVGDASGRLASPCSHPFQDLHFPL